MRDVLQQVKEAMGEDAIILSTRRVRERGSKSALPVGPVLVEVTACPGNKQPETPERVRRDEPVVTESYARREREEAPPEPARRSRFSTMVDDSTEATLSGVRAREERLRDERPAPERLRDERPAPERLRDERPAPERGREVNGWDEVPREEPLPRAVGAEASRFARLVEELPLRRGDELPRRGDELPRRGDELPRRGDDLSWRDEEPTRRNEESLRRMEEPKRSDPPMSSVLATEITTIRDTLATLEERFSNLPSDLAREVQKIPDVPGLDAEGQRRYGWLIMHGVEEPIARKLAMVERAVSEGGMVLALKRFLQFRDPLDGKSRAIVLVGPTGVGKTTTLAKIAAELLLNRRRSVGFITLDTFRVGAVAQLETYARLLQVRLVVARSPSEVKAGMQSLNRCDHILVDTVGSSPYNKRQVNSTGELLPVLGDEREVLLCMAGNVRETEQKAIFRRFSDLNPSGLIFTKLDETVTYGGVLNVALRSRLPLTFYTNGQRVPENLGWMTPEVMARWFEQAKK